MFRRDSRSRHSPRGVLFIVALLLGIDKVLGTEPGDATDLIDVARASRLSPVVLRAVRDAAAKLANPLCQEVFSDFRDAAGRTLAQDLEARRG